MIGVKIWINNLNRLTMKSHKILPVLIAVLILFQSAGYAHAQKPGRIGINITTNLNDNMFRILPEAGLVFEKQITNHSGVEAGVNYRIYERQFLVQYGVNSEMYPLVIEKYISVPVLYKFYSRIINIGAGITYDYYVGWKQLTGEENLTSYWPGADYYIGLIGKISKQVTLSDKLILEPEVKFNILFEAGKYYIGFGLVAKFDLSQGSEDN
jgi:hypothetical protein